MGTLQKYLIRELAGLNQGKNPEAIGDNEFERLENMYPFAGRLKRRNGLTKLTTAGAWGDNINQLFAYKIASGTWKLIVGGQTKLGYLSGNAVADVSPLSGVFTSSTNRFSMEQYKDIIYFARDGLGSLYRTDGAAQGTAGISAPSAAPTLAEHADAGALGSADYIGVVTFYNTVTGAESNPSAVSNTHASNAKKIAWTGIQVSTNPQVNARRCYRTLADQTGEYYRVTTITDNTTTTLTDNVLQADMGGQASFDNATPPATVKRLEIWNERLWVTDGTYMYYSEYGLPESFSEYSIIAVSEDDGHTINGHLAFGDILLVGKTNATYIISGTDESDFSLGRLSDKFGCASHASMRSAEGLAFWFGGDNFYMTDGTSAKGIGDVKVRELIDSIDSQYYNLVTGAIVDKNGWYVAGIPANGSATVNTELIFNYRTLEWATFTYDANTPIILGDFYDTNDQSIVYCSDGTGDIFQWDSGNTDNGTAIAIDILTKRFGLERDDILKIMRDVALHTNKIAESVTIDIHVDGTSRASGSYNLWSDNTWKRLALSSRDYPGTYLQLRIQCSGTSALELKGFQLKVVDLNRRAQVIA
jgi:hypothetical protein